MNNRNIAVIGCGYWGKNFVRNFNELGALAAVVEPSEAGQAQAKKIAPQATITDTAEAVFNDEAIEGVVIATPAPTHLPLGLEALKAGKDIFVEKPLALHPEDGIRLQMASQEHNKILMVGHLLEYHPAILKLRELVTSGELGEICSIHSSRLNFGKIRTAENVLWSFAPHDISVILRLLGELPENIRCIGNSWITKGIADTAHASFEFQNGTNTHIHVSWLNPFKEQKMTIVGREKMAVFDDRSKEFMLYDQHVESDNGNPILSKGSTSDVPFSDNEEPLRNECAHFLECIRERTTPLTNAQNGIDVLRVLQACDESMQHAGELAKINNLPELV